MITTQDTDTVVQEFMHNLLLTFHIPDKKMRGVIPFSYLAFQTNVQLASNWKTSSPQCYSWGYTL